MEYTVVKDFIDRGTLKEFKAGSTYACLDDSRAQLLISRGYIEGTAAPEEKEPEKKPQKAKTAAKASGSKSPAKPAAKKPASKKKV
jgi:topoisomerase IA-like protein